MDTILLVGYVAITCTIASNFAGLPVCLDILKRKSTTGVSYLPFLAATVCTLLWLQYGIMIEDTVLTFVNVIAVFMQCSYMTCYLYSTSDKAALTRLLTATAAFLLSIYCYTYHIARKEEATEILGILSCGGSICASAAPLGSIGEVFRSKSTKGLPFSIIFGTFVVSSLWFIYGTLIGNSFIQVPNFIAGAISGFQLSLFAVFSSTTVEKKSD